MYVKQVFLAAAIATVTRSEVHVVDVGEDGLRFEPQTINPKEGDTVIFHLYPRHNVVSTTFNQPCESNDNSWFSGPFDQTDDGKKKFVVNVTSENPVWYYCAVQRHCQQGMVGAWNAPSEGNTIEAFADAAQSVSRSSAPSSRRGGVLLEDEEIASLTSGNASPTESGSASTTRPPSGATTSASETESATGIESVASGSSTPGAAATAAPGTGGLALAVGLAAWMI